MSNGDPTGDAAEGGDYLLTLVCAETGAASVVEAREWAARGWLRLEATRIAGARRSTLGARLLLIRALRSDMGVEDPSIGIMLDLIDRLHMQVAKFESLNAALDAAHGKGPDDVRAYAAELLGRRISGGV